MALSSAKKGVFFVYTQTPAKASVGFMPSSSEDFSLSLPWLWFSLSVCQNSSFFEPLSLGDVLLFLKEFIYLPYSSCLYCLKTCECTFLNLLMYTFSLHPLMQCP